MFSALSSALNPFQALQPQQSQTAASLAPQPAVVTAVATATGNGRQGRYNPFMTALNTESQEFQQAYGKNMPLTKPMFLGYRDNVALYGGSRLFVLY
ncbi:MAG: hypothetical protein AB7P76_02040 [Candidatus Melainabacteria bacterium]